MSLSPSIGPRFASLSKQFVRKHPVVSFALIVFGLATTVWLLVLALNRPFEYEGKTLAEWRVRLATKEAEGLALEDWIGGKIFYPHHVRRVFAGLGDEGVLYLLGCAQFRESVVFSLLDRLPRKFRSLIPISAPTLQTQSRSRALSLLHELDSDLLQDSRVLKILKRVALSEEKEALYAALAWIVHHPDKQVAFNVLMEAYVDDDKGTILRSALYELDLLGIEIELPDDFVPRWFQGGDDVVNFFNASILYQYSSDYFPAFKDAMRAFISNQKMKSSPIYPTASLLELHDLKAPKSEKIEVFQMVWNVAENPVLKASAALGIAKLEGEDSRWWTKAREQVMHLPSECDLQNYVQLRIVLQLFPNNEELMARLESLLNRPSLYPHHSLVDLLIQQGVRHQNLVNAFERSLESEDRNPIEALRTLAYLEHPTDVMLRSLERLCDSKDQEVQELAMQLRQRFSKSKQ